MNIIRNLRFEIIIALLALIVAILGLLFGEGIIEKLTGRSIKEILSGKDQTVVVVYPVCKCEKTVKTTDTILVRLRWGATTRELAELGAISVTYRLTIDGKPIDVLTKYRQPAVFVASKDNPTPSRSDGWWVYWDVPIGTLQEGNHVIEAQAIILSTIDDGGETYVPGALETLLLKIHSITP